MKTCKKCGRTPTSRLRRGLCPADYDKWRRRQTAYGRFDELSDYTDARPAHEHTVALRKAGVGIQRISDLSGVPRRTIQSVTNRTPRKILKITALSLLSVPLPVKPHSEQVADCTYISPVGTMRRLQALVVAGHSLSALSRRMGYVGNPAHAVANGYRTYVTAAFARKVDALFVELDVTPGPDVRARNYGEARGWVCSLAWDDDTIDDPEAKPQHRVTRRVKFPERFLELRDHVGIKDLDLMADRMKIDPHSVRDQVRRYREELAS